MSTPPHDGAESHRAQANQDRAARNQADADLPVGAPIGPSGGLLHIHADPAAGGDTRGRMALLLAVIATVSVFAIGTGLSYPLLTLVLDRQGYDPVMIGANAAMMPVGLCLLSPLLPGLAERIGMAPLGVACSVGTAVLFAALLLVPHIEAWFVIRFLMGGTIAGAFVISETWINQLATPESRGRLIGLYATVVAGGFALGPAILAVIGPDGALPFLIMIGLSLASAGVILALRGRTPRLEREEGASILNFLRAAPVLVLGTAAVALFEQGSLSLLPLYFLEFGMTERLAAAALTAMIAGNIALQLPMGWLADKIGSRTVLLMCAGVGAVGAALLPLVAGGGWPLWALLLVWGAGAYGVYTSALIELGHRFSGTMLVAGNAAFGLAWGVGGLIGPSAGGALMDLSGPHGLPLFLAAVYAVVLAVAWWRHRQRQGLRQQDKAAAGESG